MNKIKQFFTWIFANKKTIAATLASGVTVATGSGVIDINALPALNVGGFNITPVLYYAVLGILILVGVYGKGFESIKTFFARLDLIKIEKENKSIIKTAQKEIQSEEKQAKLTAEQKAKAEAETARKLAVEEQKAKAITERLQKVEEAKAGLIAEKQNTQV